MSSITLEGDVDHDLVRRASEIRPLLAEHAARTEAERQVVPEVMAALEEAGLFEVLVPKHVGGLGATMATQLAVAAELAKGCASSAWVQTLINVSTWAAARMAPEEMFAGPVRPRVCGVLAPSGSATPVEGGHRVTGSWGFASGSFHATSFIGGVLVLDEAGEVTGFGTAMLPFSDLSIEDTWHVAGMCGTASNTVVADDVFVPADRFVPFGAPGQTGDDPADHWPMGTVLAIVLVGPLLGSARACAETITAKASTRPISYTSYTTTSSSMVAASELAGATLEIDTAWLHAFQATAYVDAVGQGAQRDLHEEARIRGQIGYLTTTLRHAVDRLLDVGGAGCFATANTVQRQWRDLNVGSRHAFLATNVSLETYGRSMFDLDPIVVIV